MQARDLRLLDAAPSSSPPALLARDKAIIVNLEFVKCIISTGTALRFETEDRKRNVHGGDPTIIVNQEFDKCMISIGALSCFGCEYLEREIESTDREAYMIVNLDVVRGVISTGVAPHFEREIYLKGIIDLKAMI